MLIITRSMDLDGLVERIGSRKVAVWTCRTCARLCDGLGGDEAAEKLAKALNVRGIEVVGNASTSASCLWSKVAAAMEKEPFRDADLVIPLTCDVASMLLGQFTDLPRLECTKTWGRGCLDSEGDPSLLCSLDDGSTSWVKAKELKGAEGSLGPFV
ncbi:MAG: hypothetical protein EOM68_22940 [Spirochaetia bacterium]|nr:hypothetical protein [Spirochaetia bacterium]